jgi:addiction module HigA family antidote
MDMPMMLKSRTITKQMAQVRSKRCMPPVHPGEILREEFLVPLAMSANGLALALGVPATRISEIVNERRGISGDTALRLGEYFRIGPEFWMNLQAHYELEVARGARDAAGYRKIEPAPVDKTGALLARTA